MNISRVKPGDYLVRLDDKEGRPDNRVKVMGKNTPGKVMLKFHDRAVSNESKWFDKAGIEALGYTIVERNGELLGILVSKVKEK